MTKKIKHRKGTKRAKGALQYLMMAVIVGLLVVVGVMFTVLGGLKEALARQGVTGVLEAHGDSGQRLTRPRDGIDERLWQNHELSLRQQAEELKRRVTGDRSNHLADRQRMEADLLRDDSRKGLRAARGRPPDKANPPPPQIPPPGPLGGPYPYPMDPPPDGYDIHASYLPKGGYRFAEYADGSAPYPITDEIRRRSDDLARRRRDYVKQMMKTAWEGYVQYAFGQDEIKPNSGVGDNNWGGMGVTLVDSLDTLWLLGMKDEFWKARDWVRDSLDNNKNRAVSVFETTIRSLGGLLSAYDWSGDRAFLDKALDLGKRLAKSFDGSKTGLPHGQVNLQNGRASNINWARGNVILSEIGSIQLEFRMLDKCANTRETADMRRKSELVYETMKKISPPNGLFPYYLSNNEENGLPKMRNDHLTFGAMADSFYEYMLKIWIQGGKQEPLYREMYDRAIQGMHDELLQISTPSGLTYIADKIGPTRIDHKMDHLVCFMGGLLALGAYTDPLGLESSRAQRDLKTGRALTYTCYQMYARMQSGISAEFVQFIGGDDFHIGSGAPHYLLRPETVESFFILNQLTGDPVYREWGWEVFQSIEKYCRTGVGYGTLSTVSNPGMPRDKMETFFLAETVKYMYLLQDPDTEVDILHKHVFNTEAHPMRVFTQF